MDIILNTANPLTLTIYTVVMVAIITISKKFVQIWPLIVTLVLMLMVLVYHTITLDGLQSGSGLVNHTYYCIALDLILILINFLSLLWVDDLLAKKKQLKSYDDSLSWFWNKF
jgi:hypothetical protein